MISRIERDLVSPTVAELARLLGLMNERLALGTRPVRVKVNLEALRENLTLSVVDRIEQGAFLGNAMRGVIARSDSFRPTLHAEIARVLVAGQNAWMSTAEVADAVTTAERWSRDESYPITADDVDARTRNYSPVFTRRGARVRLASPSEAR